MTSIRAFTRKEGHWRRAMPAPMALILGLPIILLYVGLVAYPTFLLTDAAFEDGLAGFKETFTGPRLSTLLTTLRLSLVVTILVILCGSVIAWTLVTTQSRLVRIVFWIAVLAPLSLSSVVKTFSFVIILSHFGIVNWISDHLGLGRHQLLYNDFAVTTGMVYTLLSYGVMTMYVTFHSIDQSLLKAAASLGATKTQIARTIVLPLSMSGTLITGVLIFVLAIGFYVTPVMLGGPKATFISSLINHEIRRNFDIPAAARMSLILIVSALVLILLTYLIAGRRRMERTLGA